MKKNSTLAALTLASFGLVFLGLQSCKKSSDSGSSSSSSYQGAGSRWTADFTGSNFTIKKYATATATGADLTVEGTYVDFSTGFRKLTVTSASGASAPAAGSTAYGLEIPGFAFFLKPMDSGSSEPIVMVASGSCPTSNFNGNWIAADFENGTQTNDSQDAFGTASFTINGASSSAVITRRTFLTATALSNSSLSFNANNCSGGVLDVGSGVEMYLTTAGAAIVKTTGSKIFAAPAQTSAVTQADLAGTYSGVAFVADSTSKNIPMKLVMPASGSATATEVNVETDASSTGAVTFSSIAAVSGSPGLFTATAVNGSDTGKINCATFTYNGYRIIGCNGYFRDDTGNWDGDSFSGTAEKAPFFFLARTR